MQPITDEKIINTNDVCATTSILSTEDSDVTDININQDTYASMPHDLWVRILKLNGMELQFVKNQTTELCEMAINQDWRALQYVIDQTEKLCLLAIWQNGYAIKHVKHQTKTLCVAAILKQPHALKYVKNKTYELCMIALCKDGNTLQYIDWLPLDEMYMIAISSNPMALKYILSIHQTDVLCRIAVMGEGMALEYVANKTKLICELAVLMDSRAVKFVGPEFLGEYINS